MSDSSPLSTFEHAGFTISSNVSSPETLKAAFPEPAGETAEPEKAPEPEQPTEDGKDPHAVALGRKGGQALAEKRAAEKAEAEGKSDEPADDGDEAARKLDEELKNTPPEQRKGRAKERVSEVTRQARELREQLERERADAAAARAELERLRTERVAAPKETPKTVADADPEPKEEDFDTHTEYMRNWARWNARSVAREEYDARAREAYVHQQAKAYTDGVMNQAMAFEKRLTEAMKADPTIPDRLDADLPGFVPSYGLPPGQIPGPRNMMANEILTSEHGVQIALHLSEHPEVRERIEASAKAAYRLGHGQEDSLKRAEIAIAREMAKLERTVTERSEGVTAGTSPTERKPEVSKAAPPVRPVTGAPAVESGLRPGMDFDEYARNWNKTQRPKLVGSR
jgi:hypothetical protein